MFMPIGDEVPIKILPIVNLILIVTCVIVFLYQLSLPPWQAEALLRGYGMTPGVLLEGRSLPPDIETIDPLLTVVTSMFLHGGLEHLIGNMLFLWIFGNNIEEAMGHVRFAMFYLICGIVAALVQGFVLTSSMVPMIGASGAISGVLGAYIVLHPTANIRTFVWAGFYYQTIRIPAYIYLGGWILFQVVFGLADDPEQGGVAWFAHIGGFMAGLALVPFFRLPGVPMWGDPPQRRPWDDGPSAGGTDAGGPPADETGPIDRGRRGPWG
jgi:membrane associated rhomboid family serine protease